MSVAPTQPDTRLRRCICLLPLDNRSAGWRGAYPYRRHRWHRRLHRRRRHHGHIARRTVFDSQKPNDVPPRPGWDCCRVARTHLAAGLLLLHVREERPPSIRLHGVRSGERVRPAATELFLHECCRFNLLLDPRLVLAWLSGARAQTSSYCEDGVISVHAGWRRDKSVVPQAGQMAVTSRERHKCSQRLSGAPVADCMRRQADPGE